jgi:hypothetical protein
MDLKIFSKIMNFFRKKLEKAGVKVLDVEIMKKEITFTTGKSITINHTKSDIQLVSFGYGVNKKYIEKLWIILKNFLNEQKIKVIYNLNVKEVGKDVQLTYCCNSLDITIEKSEK